MRLTLQRDPSAPNHTFGVLHVAGLELQTIERPWIPALFGPGGANGISCVPAGLYQLVLHNSELHPETWALVNPTLGVWHQPWDIPHNVEGQGRSDVLIHPANYASQLLGCIAPGLTRGIMGGQAAVSQSRQAFAQLKAAVPWTVGHELDIVE